MYIQKFWHFFSPNFTKKISAKNSIMFQQKQSYIVEAPQPPNNHYDNKKMFNIHANKDPFSFFGQFHMFV